MPTKYPEEFQLKVVHRYEKGDAIPDLCQEFQIASSTLYRWIKVYRTIQTPQRTYTPAEFDAISRRLKRLEHEMQIIRLSHYLDKVPLREKLDTLEQIHKRFEEYSVHELCEALDVARGTFYNHIFRRADRSKYEEEQAQLMMQVKQVFDESGQRYGAEKIRVILAENNVRVSRERIGAIMKELDLHSVRTDAKKEFKKRQRLAKQNILARNFTTEHPNQIWVSDITYFKVGGQWLYFCAILDLYSRKVVGYKVSQNASTQLVTSAFKTAYEKRGKPKGLTFHSDRGKQYTSNAFQNLLQKYGIKQSFSASGRPHDNAVSETFFATFKKEEAYRREYTSENSFRKSVEKFIQFYNEVRPHQTLGYKAPDRCEELYVSSKQEIM